MVEMVLIAGWGEDLVIQFGRVLPFLGIGREELVVVVEAFEIGGQSVLEIFCSLKVDFL
jgi:hypothetical protein